MRLQRQRLSPQVLRVSPSSSSPFHGRVAAPGRRPTGTIAAAVKVVSRPRGEEGCVLAQGVAVGRVPGEGRLVEQRCSTEQRSD